MVILIVNRAPYLNALCSMCETNERETPYILKYPNHTRLS